MENTAKIILNKCYGGYGINTQAELELLRRAGFKTKVTTNKWGDKDIYINIDGEWKNVYDVEEAQNLFDRTSPLLIKLIEEWGSDKVSDTFANLVVEEVDKSREFIIDEYDGTEAIIYKDNFDWIVL